MVHMHESFCISCYNLDKVCFIPFLSLYHEHFSILMSSCNHNGSIPVQNRYLNWCAFVCLIKWFFIVLIFPLLNTAIFVFSILSLFSSVAQSCPTLSDPMNCSTPGLPVHHQLLESTQTHVHWVGDAIQPSHPLSSPSPLAQSFPASGSFQMSQLFASGGQSIRVSASASVLPMNTQDWSPLGWTGWIFLQSEGLSRVFSKTTVPKASILWLSAFFIVQLSHPYMTTGKTIALTRWIFVDKLMSLLLNMLSRLVTTFLPRSKHLLISWL